MHCIVHCTGDGNCLFNGVSTLLYGSESFSLHLGLATTLHTVKHIDHYLEMVSFS